MIEYDSLEAHKIIDAVNMMDKYYEGEVVVLVREWGDTIDIRPNPRDRIKSRERPRRIKGDSRGSVDKR